MNWQPLFAMQKELDDRIADEHGLERANLTGRKLLALQVELCELANETRCFKYWSKKPASPRSTILEEYVDAVHFALSIGIDWQLTESMAAEGLAEGLADEPPASDLTAQFLRVIDRVNRLGATGDKPDATAYREMMAALLALGRQLGFDEAEIEAAYLAKNEVNHRRQREGY